MRTWGSMLITGVTASLRCLRRLRIRRPCRRFGLQPPVSLTSLASCPLRIWARLGFAFAGDLLHLYVLNPKRGHSMPKRVKPKSSPDNRVPLDQTVVDSLPYGLVVVQADHTITSSNATARRFLPQLGDVELCHQALSCRVPGGPCEHGCLAARAVARQGALPEIRIDMPPGAGQITAVWVRAAAVGSRPAAIFHLRPGDARDRRRRSDPHWLSGPELRITAFGRTRVDTPEGPLRGE